MKPYFFWIPAGVVLLLTLLALIGGFRWVQSYLAGPDFLGMVSNHMGRACHATADVEPLVWTGASAATESVKMSGLGGSALRSLEARQVRAQIDWRAAFSGAWRVEEITIAHLVGEFEAPGDAPRPMEPAPGAPGRVSGLLPNRFDLRATRISRADLRFGEIQAFGVSLEITPEGRGWKFQGSGGKLDTPVTPELEVIALDARLQDGALSLTSSSLRLGRTGHISASGEFSGPILVTWNSVQAADILPVAWKPLFEGVFAGEATIESGVVRGRFEASQALLQGVPILMEIATLTNTPSFRRMDVQVLSGDFEFREGVLHISKGILESKNLLRIEGGGRISPDGTLEGGFDIGVPAEILQWLPGARAKVFTEARDGYLWAPLRLGGTLQDPTEDLSKRLTAAIGETAIEAVKPLLDSIPAPAQKAVGEAINSLFDLLGR